MCPKDTESTMCVYCGTYVLRRGSLDPFTLSPFPLDTHTRLFFGERARAADFWEQCPVSWVDCPTPNQTLCLPSPRSDKPMGVFTDEYRTPVYMWDIVNTIRALIVRRAEWTMEDRVWI